MHVGAERLEVQPLELRADTQRALIVRLQHCHLKQSAPHRSVALRTSGSRPSEPRAYVLQGYWRVHRNASCSSIHSQVPR
jgi:hypothetical protein